MSNITDICDYIILRLKSEERGSDLNHLKLQKLLYYCQSWYLAFYNQKLFTGRFQAWIHGPVNRVVYNRFKDSKYMYSEVTLADVKNHKAVEGLSYKEKVHVNVILDEYAKYSPTQLELMTHSEDPWLQAREGYGPNDRCEELIDEDLMRDYYKKRL